MIIVAYAFGVAIAALIVSTIAVLENKAFTKEILDASVWSWIIVLVVIVVSIERLACKVWRYLKKVCKV